MSVTRKGESGPTRSNRRIHAITAQANPASTQFPRKQLSPAEEKLSRERFYERVKQADESLRKKAREKAIVSASESTSDDWGRTRRSRLLDDGNSWREQK